jgi:hypothetical protein
MKFSLGKYQPYFGYALTALAVTPQILFAIGAVYPPAAAAAIALQNLLLPLGIQPGVVQGVAAATGAASLHYAPEPKK